MPDEQNDTTIRLTVDTRGVATLALARPGKHNAMSEQMLDELTAAAETISRDPTIRVVVLVAEGPTFCAGGDLNWMRQQMQVPPAMRAAQAGKLAWMLKALNELPQPVIGRIHGNAFGGGVGLACICDVAIGAETIEMGLTETRLGVIPATIGPYVVARMGAARARQVFMSSRRFDAHEAVRLGLLASAVPQDDLDSAIEREVHPYLGCAPGAVAEAKALVRALAAPIDEDVITMTIEALSKRWQSPEAAEGIDAFFAKRSPSWR